MSNLEHRLTGLHNLARLGIAGRYDSSNAGLELRVPELLFGRADGGLSRIDRGLLGTQFLLRLIVGSARRIAALYQLGLPFEVRHCLGQQGLGRNESGLGGIERSLLRLRIDPRQYLIGRDVVTNLDKPLLDFAADPKCDIAGKCWFDRTG